MFYGCGRIAGEIGDLQLRPFKTINYFFGDSIATQRFVVNIVCNIIVFAPFGWLQLWNEKVFAFNKLIIGFPIAIIIIELSQYYSGRGTADVDDLLLNTIGMLLGYISFKIVEKLNAELLYNGTGYAVQNANN